MHQYFVSHMIQLSIAISFLFFNYAKQQTSQNGRVAVGMFASIYGWYNRVSKIESRCLQQCNSMQSIEDLVMRVRNV